MLRRLLFATLSLLWVRLSVAQLPDIDTFTRDMVRRDGLIPVYLDTLKGKLYLEVVPSGEDLLLVPALPAGLGSNDVGLDRGLFGEERVVQFRRTGNQILLYAPNLTYRHSKAMRRPGGPSRKPSRPPCCGAFRSWRAGRSVSDRRHRLCPARRHGRGRPSAPDQSGYVSAGPRPEHDPFRGGQGLSPQHGDRSAPYVFERATGPFCAPGSGRARARHTAPASDVCGPAATGLSASRTRSTERSVLHHLLRLHEPGG